ncbi:MAG: hypothetical protein P0S94_02715 [Simkaniaceae bacterium]|nr:hypothetical protein [Simkaniaceae bacterium]
MGRKKFITIFLLLFLCASTVHGADAPAPLKTAKEIVDYNMQGGPDSSNPNVVMKLAVLAGLTLLPFAIMLLTSYLKMVIVLALLRNALGVQQSPPNQAINGIALLMTIYVMAPTLLAMYDAGGDLFKKSPPQLISGDTAGYLVELVDKTKEPLREILESKTITQNQK